MALQLGDLRNALAEAGASAGLAARASEEVAGYVTRVSKLEADIGLIKWMVGVSIALALLILSKQFMG